MDEHARRDTVEEILWRAFHTNHAPCLVLDETGGIVLASPGLCELLKREESELEGHPFESFVYPAPDIAGPGIHGTCSNGQPLHLDLLDANKNLIPIEAQCHAFGDSTGRTHCLLMLRDLREAHLQEQEQAARISKLSLLNQVSEALYAAHLTLDQILEAILICVTAGQGLRFNRAFLLLIDAKSEALRGEIAIGPANHDEAARIWRDLADRKLNLYEMMTRYDRSVRQTDVGVNEMVKQLAIPMTASDHVLVRAMREGRPLRVEDATGLPGADELRLWLGAGVFAVAPLVNRRGPLGVIVADNAISGTPITDLDLEFLQLFANESANAIENSRLYGELQRRLVDLRKVTERQKKDQETLLRMERLSVMGETSAIVAHELRNPLVAIGGFARTLLRALEEDDPNRRFAQIITEEVTRLERIIHDLLDFIRPQKLLRKAVRGDEMVRECALHFRDQMREKGLELALDLQAVGVTVNVNPGEIQQVLQNFLMNAMQAKGESPGRVEVRTRQIDGGMLVEVLDDGPGLAEEPEKLFTPFYTTKTTGSGLGLTICSQIIKAHGGVINARNRPEGGAAFSFILPLPRPAGEPGEPVAEWGGQG